MAEVSEANVQVQATAGNIKREAGQIFQTGFETEIIPTCTVIKRDPVVCLSAYCCYPCMSGRVFQALGEDCLLYGLLSCCPPFNGYFNPHRRQLVRAKKGIAGTAIGDVLYSCCSCGLSLAQEAHEVGAKLF